jgi:hypothetical protein
MPDVFPSGWTKTIADLMAESNRTGSSVGPPETDWAIAFERSQLRPWARFPLDGEVYQALHDIPVRYLTHWQAPFTGGGDGTLPASTMVRVHVHAFMPEPVAVSAMPLNSREIELLLVAGSDRSSPKYDGFSLHIYTADLNRHYRRVES